MTYRRHVTERITTLWFFPHLHRLGAATTNILDLHYLEKRDSGLHVIVLWYSWCSWGVRRAVAVRNVLTHYRDSCSTQINNNWITAHSFQALLTLWKSWHDSLIHSDSHCVSVGSPSSFMPVLLGKAIIRNINNSTIAAISPHLPFPNTKSSFRHHTF